MRETIGTLAWHTVTDNYTPARGYARGTADVYSASDTAPETIVLHAPDLRDATDSIYLVDDGQSVRPHYVAGWRQDNSDVFLHPFPLSQGTRPDGRPVDMSGWILGPRRAYHLKVTRTP